MEKLSALVITYNEEDNMRGVLETLSFADEIVVVDSGSTDRTKEIATKYSTRFFERPFESYAQQKNWGIEQCNHNWVLILDADERIPDELREEITERLYNPKDYIAFRIKRRNHFMGKRVRYSGWQNDKVFRLFNHQYARYKDSKVHEEMEVRGKYEDLLAPMDHYTYRDLSTYLEKSWKYATLGAYDRFNKGKKVTAYHLLVKPVWGFVNKYIIRLGFLDGRVGLIISLQHSSYLFNRALKLWRLQEGEKIPIK